MITKSKMSALYSKTAEQFRREPNDSELDAWMKVLSDYRLEELSQALDRWVGDTTIEEFTNKPKGSRMPSPAELKLSIKIVDQGQQKKFVACGLNGCMDGWVMVYIGLTVGGNKVDPKVGAATRCQCFLDYCAARKKVA